MAGKLRTLDYSFRYCDFNDYPQKRGDGVKFDSLTDQQDGQPFWAMGAKNQDTFDIACPARAGDQ